MTRPTIRSRHSRHRFRISSKTIDFTPIEFALLISVVGEELVRLHRADVRHSPGRWTPSSREFREWSR